MVITVGGWIGFLVGITFGAFVGLIAGIIMADEHWRKNKESIFGQKGSEKAPYEIEKHDDDGKNKNGWR